MDAKEMKKSKKNLDILQVAATDKENLSRKIIPKKKITANNGRMRLGKKELKATENKNIIELNNMKNKIETQKKGSSIIIPNDLTSDSPSEKYWEELAESRRIALESALKENETLHNKLLEMEYENGKLKEMYNEAYNLVQVLTEMLDGKDDDKEDNSNENNQSIASTSQQSLDDDTDEGD